MQCTNRALAREENNFPTQRHCGESRAQFASFTITGYSMVANRTLANHILRGDLMQKICTVLLGLLLYVAITACGTDGANTATPPPTPTAVPSLIAQPTSAPITAPSPTRAMLMPPAQSTGAPTARPTLPPIAPTASAATTPDPCKLLADAEVEAMLGALTGAPEAQPDTQFGGVDCSYTSEKGLLFVGVNPGGAAKFNEVLAALKSGNAPLAPVPGLGDEAQIATDRLDPAKPEYAGVLVIRKGNAVVSLLALTDLDEAPLRDGLKVMGQKVLARLPK